MAMKISDECTACGVCEDECPSDAISEGDEFYVIDAEKCTECKDEADAPQCAEVCPVECISKIE